FSFTYGLIFASISSSDKGRPNTSSIFSGVRSLPKYIISKLFSDILPDTSLLRALPSSTSMFFTKHNGITCDPVWLAGCFSQSKQVVLIYLFRQLIPPNLLIILRYAGCP